MAQDKRKLERAAYIATVISLGVAILGLILQHNSAYNVESDEAKSQTDTESLDRPSATETSSFGASTQAPVERQPTQDSGYLPKDGLPVVFQVTEFDIYINKVSLEAFIFHGKLIDYNIERLEYDRSDYSVVVVMRDGRRFDLGARIEWILRDHFEKLDQIGIVRTHEGESVDGVYVPIVHVP